MARGEYAIQRCQVGCLCQCQQMGCGCNDHPQTRAESQPVVEGEG